MKGSAFQVARFIACNLAMTAAATGISNKTEVARAPEIPAARVPSFLPINVS